VRQFTESNTVSALTLYAATIVTYKYNGSQLVTRF